ncbi:amino acid permease 6-like isoform X2 [Durio zibethinus]|uniref:Amino acid permease 6-like isoform X2 n=1 Tax=Durio zibethinus TaxID=66656 RepID=A0A6P5XF03_DURZI|nr:amino acid permease 6-like isoform X2 [Durio zibethinus]
MTRELQGRMSTLTLGSMELETGKSTAAPHDGDDSSKRKGTWVTASAHIITAVIGSGVLSLSWAVAQLGWIAGVGSLLVFSVVTWAIKRSGCFHKNGHDAGCHVKNNKYMIIFGIIEIIISQIPNFHELSGLSVVAAAMSFAYSIIGLGLSIARVAEGTHARTRLTGTTVGVDVTRAQKIWNSFEALGDIAFSYAFSAVLVEIQDTVKSSPPENEAMKKAASIGVSITTLFYISCGVLGYAAFGNDAPGNFLTGFGFYNPYWLIDLANVCIIVHLVGAYQVFCQPLFERVENWCFKRWPNNSFIKQGRPINLPLCGVYHFSAFRLVWRTAYVIMTAVVAMIIPFFNDILGLLGAVTFWPLTVYFPIQMHIAREKIQPYSWKWIWLNVLVVLCLIVSLLAATGSIQGIVKDLRHFKPFTSVS